jgi:hypothetical protein
MSDMEIVHTETNRRKNMVRKYQKTGQGP